MTLWILGAIGYLVMGGTVGYLLVRYDNAVKNKIDAYMTICACLFVWPIVSVFLGPAFLIRFIGDTALENRDK